MTLHSFALSPNAAVLSRFPLSTWRLCALFVPEELGCRHRKKTTIQRNSTYLQEHASMLHQYWTQHLNPKYQANQKLKQKADARGSQGRELHYFLHPGRPARLTLSVCGKLTRRASPRQQRQQRVIFKGKGSMDKKPVDQVNLKKVKCSQVIMTC